jgi:hydrogenase-4 component F
MPTGSTRYEADGVASQLLIFALLAVPVAGAVACMLATRPRQVPAIAIAASGIALAIAAWLGTTVLSGNPGTVADGMFVVDAFSGFHLIVLALVFLICSLFASVYFADEGGAHFSLGAARRFGALWLGSLAAMILVLVSNNLGIMWVGMEATTLLTAFLISFHRGRLSLEAMWKYLLICSVGIAFAFIGTIFTAAAVQSGGGGGADALLWTRLAAPGMRLDPTLMTFAFIFVLVGYGTKAGLAPLHSWLPDAHSQAPAPVSAMFSGFLLNTALYCIMRFVPPARNALGGFADGLLVFFGVLSILVAAGFIVFQRDAKRFLAYSSVEHLGIIALGYGLGPLGTFAALFHTLNHSLSKTLAFCAVGRLGQRFGTHDMDTLSGALREDRLWGLALVCSVLSLIGAAPFAIFMSEYQLLRAAAGAQKWVVLAVFLAAASVVFISALRHLIDMAFGDTKAPVSPLRSRAAGYAVAIPPLAALVFLGLWLPPWLVEAIGRAAAALGVPA